MLTHKFREMFFEQIHANSRVSSMDVGAAASELGTIEQLVNGLPSIAFTIFIPSLGEPSPLGEFAKIVQKGSQRHAAGSNLDR
jgi:hypothetical protein